MAIELETLELEIVSSADQAAAGIDALTSALTGLSSASAGGAGLRSVANSTEKISSALSSLSGGNIGQLTQLRAALETLSEGTYGNSALNSAANQLKKVNEAVNGLSLDRSKLAQLDQLRDSLGSLASVEAASGLNTTINALRKLPEAAAALNEIDFDAFAEKVQQATDALEPLASAMDRVSRGFQAFPIRIQKLISSNGGLAASNQKTAASFNAVGKAMSALNLAGFTAGLRLAARQMGNWVEESNSYTENMNLFTVAMGEAADSAYEYAQRVHEVVGIDPADWMRNQGVFMQIASGFGVANDKAVLMSKNLTQLGYDISSFYNIGVEEAMQKVQSGISGELEPLRRLGYALDQATLKEVALSEGITKSFNAMTQAEKSQLRYIAMLRQSTNVMGDMARTVITPANAMRILQQQVQQLSRALGNVLIPFLMKLIPVAQAVVEVFTELINLLAALVGFQLPQIDYSGLGEVSAGVEDVEDALDSATKAAKKFSTTLGIDELNIISPPDSSGGGAGAAGGGVFGDLDLPEYDFLKDAAARTDELKDMLRSILYDYVLPIGAAFGAWKILDLLSQMKELGGMLQMSRDAKMLLSITAAVVEFKLVRDSAMKYLSPDGSLLDILKQTLAAGAGAAVLGMLWGAKGVTVGFAIAALATISAIYTQIADNVVAYNDPKVLLEQCMAAAFAGLAGFKLMGAAGGLAGVAIGFGISLLATSIAAHVSGQLQLGTAESAWALLKGALGGGLAGLGIGFVLGGPAGAAVGFVVGVGISLILEAIVTSWENIKSWFSQFWSTLTGNISAIWEDINLSWPQKFMAIGFDIVSGLLGGILEAALGLGTWLKENLVDPLVNGVKELLGIHSPSTVFAEIGGYIIEGLLSGLSQGWNNVIGFFTQALPNWWETTIAPWFTAEKWQQTASGMVSGITESWTGVVTTFTEGLPAFYNDTVAPWFTAEKWRELGTAALDGLFAGLNNMWNKAKDWGGSLIDNVKNVLGIHSPSKEFEAIGNYATAGFVQGFADLKGVTVSFNGELEQMRQSSKVLADEEAALIANGLDSFLSGLKTAQENNRNTTSTMTSHYRTMASASNSAIASIISKLNEIPRNITTVHTIVTKNEGSSTSTSTVKGYATGGFPRAGELFYAREGGMPELVGNIGGRTAVANNDQIVTAIQQGVYQAMTQALSQQGEQGVNVYLDGKQLRTAINQANREAGASIMGGGSYRP